MASPTHNEVLDERQSSDEAAEAWPEEESVPVGPMTVVVLATPSKDDLDALFDPLTPQLDTMFVVTFATDDEQASGTPELPELYAGMPVTVAKADMELLPGVVFVVPPGTPLVANDGVFALASERDARAPARALLGSLTAGRGHRGIVVLLSASGQSGAALREVKATGGILLAETRVQYERIVGEGITPNVFDRFVPKQELGVALLKLLEQTRRLRGPAADQHWARDAATYLDRILTIVRSRTGHDFRQYKRNTIVRRVQRRMQVTQVDSVEAYLELLRTDAREANLLFQDMLIGVTHFFRDPDAFEVVRSQLLPEIFARKSAGQSVRVWVPGCATGEEAYSLAFLFMDYIDRHGLDVRLQIFATDIDEHALHVGRRGIYPSSVDHDVPPDLRRPFMYECDGAFCVNKRVRDCLMFSVHNVVKDPPFSKLDLIACRNLFIYFSAELQARLIPIFHYALLPRGYMFLGPAEGLGSASNMFGVFDKRSRIFERRELSVQSTLPRFQFAHKIRPEDEERPLLGRTERQTSLPLLATLVERTILQAYSPACVVINDRFESLYFLGQTGKFLQQAEGPPTLNLLDLARPGLRTQLRASIHHAITRREPAESTSTHAPPEGGSKRVQLEVRPMSQQMNGSDLYLVIFREDESDAHEPFETASNRAGDAAMDHLELELKRTQEQLQSIMEEFESSNEEFKSSNEELLSMNEELQSSNEELETAKEELQSVNEELETVNLELKLKVDELAHANSDIRNLFDSTRIATLFLDNDLRIRNFTPATADLFSLIDTDRGRPIGHIAPRFRCDQLQGDLSEVIRTLVTSEQQVESHEGGWFIMRIMPYRSTENVIEGVVVTFTDITRLKRAELEVQRLKEAADEQLRWMKTLMEVVPVGIAYHSSSVPGVRINRAAGDILGLPQDREPAPEGDGLARVVWRNRIVPPGASAIFDVLVALEPARDRRVEITLPALGARQLAVQAATFEPTAEGALSQVSAFIDITEMQRAREEAMARERQQAAIAELGLMALGSVNLDGFFGTALTLLAGVAQADACEVLRLSDNQLEPVSRIGFTTVNTAPVPLTPSLEVLLREGRPALLSEESERSLSAAPFRQLGLTSGARVPIASHDGRPYGVLSVYTREAREFSAQDLTFLRAIANVFASALQRQELEDTRLREHEAVALRRSEVQLRRAERLASLGTFATGIAHELNNPLNNISLAAGSMEMDGDQQRQEKLLTVIRSNAERCGRIIESVLRFARDEDSRKWPIDLNALLQHATEMAGADFDTDRLRFELKLDKDVPRLRCNPTELEQVFINLIRNAAQAHPGQCTVSISTENTAAGARIVVSDDGPGIPQKDLSHIFDPFFSTKRRNGGTGLGLSITHRIVTAHGGVVRASSDPGKGAKFVIEIPFGRDNDDEEEEDGDHGEGAPS